MVRRPRTAASAFLISALLAARPAEPADETDPARLTLCLAGAADGSPVYPLAEVPANHREMVAAFRVRDREAIKSLTATWVAVDVGDAASPGSKVGTTDLALQGKRTGTFRFSLPNDLPLGKYRLEVAADGKPWAAIDFPVVAATKPIRIAEPEDLLPLAVGTKWTYAFVLEVGAVVKKFSMTGATKGDDGKWRAAATYAVAAAEPEGARVEIRRGDVLVNEEWWRLDAQGLAVTKERQGEATVSYDPPVPVLRLPVESPGSWTHRATDGSFQRAYRVWGPLPVAGPNGPVPGFVVLAAFGTATRPYTIERHVAPGIGIVREVQVDAVSGNLVTRIEMSTTPAK